MRTYGLVFSLAFMLLFGSSAKSQEISVFAGGLFPGHGTVNGQSTPLDRGPIYGVRLTTGFAAFLKLEAALALSNDFLFPHNVAGVTGAKGILVNANLAADIPVGKRFVPFLTAGLGFMHQYGSNNLPVGTKFNVNYGGGLKLPRLFGPAGLRFDARGYTATHVFSRSVNMFELSGGIMVSF